MKRLLAALLLAAPLAASAEGLAGRTGIGGTVGAAVPLGSKWVKDTASTGLGLGAWIRHGLCAHWSAGLSYDNLGMGRVRTQPVMANAFYHPMPSWSLNPNIHAGLGVTALRGVERSRTSAFGAKVGLGADYVVWKDLSLGAAVDYHFAARNPRVSHDVSGLFAGMTLGWWFDLAPARPAPAKAAAPAPVRTAAAPPPAKPAPPPSPLDSDKDGVADEKDRCPGTPAGTAVNSMGCPKAEKVSIRLAVEFDTAKAVVKPQYDDQLRKVSDFMKTYPDTKAEIEGHTDSVGADDANKRLSQRRADAVRQALIERFGVAADRLSAAGYGEERPIADNTTAEGRAKNRRVLATFTANKP